MKHNTQVYSLNIVREKRYDKSDGTQIILPKQLLEQNVEGHYVLQDIQKLSPRFSSKENIYILAHEVNEDFPCHSHVFFELTYICQGSLLNIIDGKELYMSQGDISLMNTQAIQKLKCIEPGTLIINFCIKHELFERTLENFVSDNNPVSAFLRGEASENQSYMFFSLGCNKNIPILINNIIEEYTQAGFHQTYALEAWMILLFTQMVKSGSYSYYGIDEKAWNLLQYIRENGMNHTLEEMAGSLGYNTNYLTDYIKKHTGRNFKDIIKEMKLNEALRLLKDTQLSVYQIAEECGYSSQSHFFRIFKENYHMTPGDYRKQ